MHDASAKPWFIETGSEDVWENEFDFGLSLPVSDPSGPVIGLACYPCRAAFMLMRLCGFAPVPLCGFCPAVAACFSMMFSWDDSGSVSPGGWFQLTCGHANPSRFSQGLQGLAAATVCHSMVLSAVSHVPAGFLVLKLRPSLLPSSC